jgi:hypothetical protein
VKYQFFEHESNKTAYQVGTYMQSKKVFNIGAGYQYQADAMSKGNAALPEAELYDIKHWAVDSFLNLPLANNDAITGYLGYYDYGFGENYIRNVGANNITSGGGDDFNGAGVALNQKMTVYDFGVNFMLNGTHANKISLGYQYRPIFDKNTLKQIDAKGMAVLQYSIAFN